jgi:hypothetical protein
MMLDGLDADRGGEMRLAHAGAADQDDIVRILQELATMELTCERLVDLAAGEVEACEIGVLDKTVEWPGRRHQMLASSDQASEIMPGCEPCRVCAHSSRQRVSSQSFSAASEGKLGVGCQSRWRASWTFFSICPFSYPEAGLQNSASNRKWLTIAEKRALTWRSLPRPTLSTAVRILS